MIKKYFILLLAIVIFLLLLLELRQNITIANNISSEYLHENYESYKRNNKIIYYPRVVTWSPSYVDNYYQPGYNQYFYNNGYYYPVY